MRHNANLNALRPLLMGLLVAPGPLSPISSSSLVLPPGPTGGSSLICQFLCASGCQASAASMPPTVPGPFGDQFGALTFDFPVGIDEDDDAEAELAAGVAPVYDAAVLGGCVVAMAP